MTKAIFIDKDGTLIVDVPYNVDPDRMVLAEGAGAALRRFKDAGYLLVVVSNQSGVAKGLFEEATLVRVRQRLDELLRQFGVVLDGFYYCPHFLGGKIKRYAIDCDCRKPKMGMLTTAAQELAIDLKQSWMIGDIVADSEAGNRAGCHTILIEKPYDPVRGLTERNCPDYIVQDWHHARGIVLSERYNLFASHSASMSKVR